MNFIKTLTQAAAVALLLGSAVQASASSQTWALSGATFDDGTTLSGSFVYDADADNVLSYSISVQLGTLPAFTYDMTDSSVYSYTAGNPIAAAAYGPNELLIENNDGSSSLLLSFASTPTDAGGTVALLTNADPTSPLTADSYENNADSSATRYVTQGVVTTAASPVPEPASRSLALCGLAGLLLVGIRRRQARG